MDRSFAAQRPRLATPQPADALRWARRLLRGLRLRRRLAIALGLLAVVVVGGWFALRDSSLVSIERVQIRGVHGTEAANVREALTRAAEGQSTMHVRVGALMAAVAPYHVVKSLQVSPSFPHGVRITVVEQLPVASLVAGNGRSAVAADGTLLGPDLASDSVPQIGVAALPARRMADPRILGQLAVLGAAPAPLAPRVSRIWVGPGGIAVAMRNGPTIVFGDATRPHAKWAAASRVLADPSSAGASYIDVRIPERPAAGGLPLSATGVGTQVSSATDPTAALAADLGAAVSGSSTAGTTVPGLTGAATLGPGTASAGSPAAGAGAAGAGAAGTASAPGATATATPATATGTPATATGTPAYAGSPAMSGAGPGSGSASGTSGTGAYATGPTAPGPAGAGAGTGGGTTSGQQSTSTGG